MNRPTAVAAVIGCALATSLAVAGHAVMHASATTPSHTLRFTSQQLRTTPFGKTEEAEADRLLTAGTTVGFGTTLCTFDFATGVAHCNVTATVRGGMIYGRIAVKGQQGTGHGSVTGGTGSYKDAKGSITTQPGSRKGDTKVTITYHR